MRARATAVLVLVLLIGAAEGCYDSDPCGAEVCDGRDNDCDDRTDEGFVDAAGDYTQLEHCGSCNVACAAVVPTAETTECRAGDDGEHRCIAASCPQGEVLRDGACGAPTIALCAPCDRDEECEALAEGAKCLAEGHCGQPCVIGNPDCPRGFDCLAAGGAGSGGDGSGGDGSGIGARVVSADGQCTPTTGSCSCTPAQIGLALGCALVSPDGARCVGERECTASGLTECRPAIEEACNELDDDCNGAVDEGFVDDAGRYVSAQHCGACNSACIAPGEHMVATCAAPDADLFPEQPPSCELACEEGFVDVDGLSATGCECRLLSPDEPVIGGDANCDGAIDETPDLIFVAPQGNDASDGEDVSRPVRTLARGSELGELTGRRVLVARGVYQGPLALIAGVTLLGGYSPDFREGDPSRHPSLIEHGSAAAGAPVVTCTDIGVPTRLEGFTVLGTDATAAGAGSTTLYLSGCTDQVALADITVLAGRGAAGTPGDSSSGRLAAWGLSALTELSGADGGDGSGGTPIDGGVCTGVPAGGGGNKICQRGASQNDVSGGEGGASECTDLSTLCSNGSGTACGNAGCTDFTSGGVCDLDAALAIAVPQPAAQPGRGDNAGAEGVRAYSAPTNRNVCSFCDDNPSLPREGGPGGDGAPGGHGASGSGCSQKDVFDIATGRMTSGAGVTGGDGADGSGGGGATAGGGFSAIGNTLPRDGVACMNRAGGSGGGGGSGGCGAPGAAGGSGGGSSIGIAVRLGASATGPSFTRVRVVTGSGGDGGPGGIGAAGGTGGTGALGGGAFFFCARNGGRGGDGGPGGAGGGAGGGCGGSSYGVILVGDPSDPYLTSLDGGTEVERAGVAGRAGAGGFSPGNRGSSGLAGSVQDRLVLSP